MNIISRNITLYLPLGVALIIVAIVVFYTVTAGSGTGEVAVVNDHAVADTYMTHKIEADATLHEIEEHIEAEETPAYEEPIEELIEAIEEAEENISEDLEEGVNPFMDDEAETLTEADLTCDFDSWIGETVSAIDLEAAGRPYRVLEPGAMYTMDHVPERINLHTDEEGTVLQVTCG